MNNQNIMMSKEGDLNPSAGTQLVRATLYHMNGLTSQMVISMPNYTMWGECYESAAMMLTDYVFYLATRFIQIEKFNIEMGSLGPDGVFLPGDAEYRTKRIPQGKVYHRGTRGKWISQEDPKLIILEGGSKC